jgi:hypothetical protein
MEHDVKCVTVGNHSSAKIAFMMAMSTGNYPEFGNPVNCSTMLVTTVFRKLTYNIYLWRTGGLSVRIFCDSYSRHHH